MTSSQEWLMMPSQTAPHLKKNPFPEFNEFNNLAQGEKKVALKEISQSHIPTKSAFDAFIREDPKNILIHDGHIKIAGFGLSKDTATIDQNFGKIFYIDLQCFLDPSYKNDYKSDVYSTPIFGTPKSYVQLYQECWDTNPEVSPPIDSGLLRLTQYQWNQFTIKVAMCSYFNG
ncbi:hypothetical protein G9A89_010744 [Geosiphon pyriformis]|nr:hypothetical protein G9A89_010744 [Geosiphon pyriformis]